MNGSSSIENVIQRIQLPKEIQSSYESMGVKSLYDWQSECLFTTDVLKGRNLIYCAPTSGGKTLVAELVLLRTVLVLKKKAIFVLPYVSLVIEKEKYTKKLLNRCNRNRPINERIKVRGFYGDHAGSRSFKEHILICTIEKANGIFNTLLMRNRGNQIGCLVFDEFHVLGNSFNGSLIEILISKIKFMEYKSKLLIELQQLQIQNIQEIPLIDSQQKAAAIRLLTDNTSSSPESSSLLNRLLHIQIIALSATMGNVQELADWLHGDIYRTNFRPIPLIERIKAGNELLEPNAKLIVKIPSPILKKGEVDRDPDHFIHLCDQGLRRGQQILIFCSSKFACLQTCKSFLDAFLASTATMIPNPNLVDIPMIISHKKLYTSNIDEMMQNKSSIHDIINARKQLLELLLKEEPHLEATLQSSILHGIAYHHAGLNPSVRSEIEKGFRNGCISVLSATSTLAAGVNLPAGRVLIRSLQIGKDYLNVMQYRQMIGRAGRMGQGANVGESFLLVKSIEKSRALELSNKPMPNVTSQLDPQLDAGNALLKAILEGVGLGLCSTIEHAIQYTQQTLLYKQYRDRNSALSGNIKDNGINDGLMLSTVLSILQFLISTRILDSSINNCNDLSKLLANEEKENSQRKNNSFTDNNMIKSTLKITRFGKAIMQSNTDPDEAIVIYESLLRAQDGLHLESSLHLLYLITPLEHKVYPNFRKLLSFYESSHSSKQRLLANIFDAIGVDYATLNRWQVNPPSRSMIDICSDAVKLHGIYANHPHYGSGSKNTSSITTDISQYKQMKKSEWQILCRCKRIWAAIVLQGILDGKPVQIICKEFEIEANDIDTLQRSTQIMNSKVIRFCDQIGWSSMERIFSDFKPFFQMSTEDTIELKPLMMIPMMTSKMARVLFQNNILDSHSFVNIAPEVIAQILQLSIGFEMQEIEHIEVQLEQGESQRNHSTPSPSSNSISESSSTQCSTTSSIMNNPNSSIEKQQARDELIKLRLTALISTLQSAARSTEEKRLLEIDAKACDVLAAIDKYSQKSTIINKALYPMDLEYNSDDDAIEGGEENGNDSDISGSDLSDAEIDSEIDDLFAEIEGDQHIMQCNSSSPIENIEILDQVDLQNNIYADFKAKRISKIIPNKVTFPIPPLERNAGQNPNCSSHNFDPEKSPALKIIKISHEHKYHLYGIANQNATNYDEDQNSSRVGNNDSSIRKIASPFKDLNFNQSLHNIVISPLQGNISSDRKSSSLMVYQWEGLSEEDLNALMEDLESSGILQVNPSDPAISTETASVVGNAMMSNRNDSNIHNNSDGNHYIYYPMVPPLDCKSVESKSFIHIKENEKYSPHKAISSIVGHAECNSAYKISIYKINSSSKVATSFNDNNDNHQNEIIDFDAELLKTLEELERKGVLMPVAEANCDHFEALATDSNMEQSTKEEAGQQISIDENSRDSVVSCSDLLKDSFANSLTISNTFESGVKHLSIKSPYISPFTASKIQTPGMYLYYPIWQADRNSSDSPLSTTKDSISIGNPKQLPLGNNVDIFSRLVEASSDDKHKTSHATQISPKQSEHLLQEISQYPSELKSDPLNRNPGFGIRQIRNSIHCMQFLKKLQKIRCISFELVYRPLPVSWLSRYKLKDPRHENIGVSRNSISSMKQQPSVFSWTPYISWACSKLTSITCNTSDNYLETNLSTDGTAKRNMFRMPHVLIGVALNLGDEFGYYLPLPTPLPLIPNPYCSDTHVNRNKDSHITVSIEDLPSNLREAIASYVGFGLILTKCPLLRKYCQQNKTVNSKVFETLLNLTRNNESNLEQIANPLFLVSKKWCFSTRSALLLAWRKGACIEWKVFSDLLSNTKITKVAMHLKSKMVVLRERDLLVEGPIEDPSIAQSLLINCQQQVDDISLKVPKLTIASNRGCIDSIHNNNPTTITSSADIMNYEAMINGQKIACFRAVAVMRVMAEMEVLLTTVNVKLRSCSMLDLYRNIEMPLLYCTSDAELTGFQINSAFFSRLRQSLTDRQRMIQSYFYALYGPSFNLDSHIDVRKLKNKFIQEVQMGLSNKVANILKLPTEEEITQVITQNHPLIQMISEYRSNIRTLPLCSSILGSRYFDRVRAVYNTLGTETGRVVLINPPLQQIPKLCTFLNAERISLHEELENNCIDESRRKAMISYLNAKYETKNIDQSDDQAAPTEREWVRVVSLHQASNFLLNTTNTSIDSISIYSTGKLVRILDVPITEAPVSFLDSRSNTADLESQSLLDIWCNAGFDYKINEAVRIRQVIVEFSDISTASKDHSSPYYYAYPADKVFRINADIKPNADEVSAIHTALQQPSEWILPFFDSKATSLNSNFGNFGSTFKSKQYLHNCSIKVRDGFQSSEGYILLAADYSQIELRILSHYASDQMLCTAFMQDIDVFKAIASSWLSKPLQIVSDIERNQVKQICYALIYGAGPGLVAEQANITTEVAKQMMNDFLTRYPGIQNFIINTKKHARKIGYVETLLGRRRYLPDLNSKDKKLQSKAERQAVNTLCQGSAADLIKLAMINIHYKLSEFSRVSANSKKHNSGTADHGYWSVQFRRSRKHPGAGLYRLLDDVRPVLQVHDELIFEVKIQDLYKVSAIVKECMENAVQLNVPLHVKLSSGKTWGSLTPFDLNHVHHINTSVNHASITTTNTITSTHSVTEKSALPVFTLYQSVMNGSTVLPPHNNSSTHNQTLMQHHSSTATNERNHQPPVIRDLFGRD